ncbi:ferrochelatase [Gordonia soli]|uniref:Coproporphyrin III ferrochelatase n=1 Tax=Gordonia soli NBRC 108243 TaxID=1223545 RepID=M0QKB1_9ACTN|nr:ferrochelatase [Gordonia soli]GAC68731.1 ferrochelatase [Gordonia soli NBRC 108243]
MTTADASKAVGSPIAFDAVLFLSFGGPDEPADVRPFLENVTRGRGVPPERLDEVAEHYLHFGGVSPINRLNLEMIDSLRGELVSRGVDLPVFFGNRNWHPMIEDTVVEMYRAGHRRVLVFPTSAWGGYSGCRQYNEDIGRALSAATAALPEIASDPMLLRKLPQYWHEPSFVEAFGDAVIRAVGQLPNRPVRPRLVFTAHSIPVAADRSDGPAGSGGQLYQRQVSAAAAAVAEKAGYGTEFDLVWQSRSGPPQVPWLEPDICDHLEIVATQGAEQVVVCPVGFVSDHLEVVWDLDNEAAETAERLGLGYVRADTVGTDTRFIALIADLIDRYRGGEVPTGPTSLPGDDAGRELGCADNGSTCRAVCCVPARRPART